MNNKKKTLFGKKRKPKIPFTVPIIVVDSASSSSLAAEQRSPGWAIPAPSAPSDEEDDMDEESGDGKDVPDVPECTASFRRNSISLPNLDALELNLLENYHRSVSEQEDTQKTQHVESDTSDDEFIVKPSVPLKNYRRKSVTSPPLKMLKPQGDDDDRSNSPANSITSINSLASLLREKMQMFPGVLKKKKPHDYKIRACVAFLFLTIIFLVTLAYVLYQQKVLQRAYFEKIKFNKAARLIEIYNLDGINSIRGRLGITMNYKQAHSCLPADERNDGSICFEWMDRARLYLKHYDLNPEVRCYNLQWISLSENINPTDCFDLSLGSGHWYGGGQTSESAWPLEKGLHSFAPFVTGRIEKHEWGNVLRRFFLNSKGAAILIDNETPLYVSVSNQRGRELCLQGQYDSFAFVNRLHPLPHLTYSVCIGSGMTRLHSFMTEKTLWDGLKKEEINIIYSLLTEPLWEITTATKEEFTEGAVANYTDDVIALGFLKQGHVLINEFWQKQIGDFTVDTERFPSLEETITIMHRRGFRIVFTIQPYISTESESFAHAVKNRYLISERFSDRRIPALTRYKSLESAGVLDITYNRTIPWFQDKLRAVMNKYKFDAFYLDLGVAYNMPHYYQCEKPLINPDHYKTQFINSIQGAVNIFGVNSAIEMPRAPSFVSLPQFESSWDGLQRVIPTVLTYGLIGYPFLIPGAVGGDYEAPGWWASVNSTSDADVLLPDKELYVRWLQLATFLPVIRFTHLPSKYGDDKVLEMARILTLLRQQTVTPYLKKYADEALDSGLPLIRPLWMIEPNDPACHIVADEFSVGEDLIVAPVLYSGARQREVYLPAGVWKDGIDGSLRKGNRWIHDYKVEDNQIAYFEKMPDNTRF
ncbi:myogenesis-regulating glycosidase isoform X1 [Photinus pyralis]|uniref:Glycoside hydrolase family 31 N-terminal domain-containing protein n=2 Tax=Photinus pyralis TaxID=7054 RepID=A0A1Y1LC30_PHOPY|nr:myogenesis-regulating glycosidase isoform X1 [Photinus pyralis]